MQTHYLEIVTFDVEATCATYAGIHKVTFSDPVEELGNARTAEMADGSLLAVRAPLSETENPVVRPYMLVKDLGAAVAAADEAGATLALPPTEIAGRGMISIFIEGGVEHGLWQK